MAAEAVPPPSFEAQGHEEYIDYSEDDATAPTVAAQNSNRTSFSANAHFVTENYEEAAASVQIDDQSIDLQAVEVTAVASDAQPDGSGQGLVEAGYTESATVADQAPQNIEDVSFNDNEISWEDGNDNQAGDASDAHLDAVKGEWQLVDDDIHLAEEESDLPKGMPDIEDKPQGDEEDASESTGNSENVHENAQEISATDAEPLSQEQTSDVQGVDADGDLHEIDYFDDSNAAADASMDTAAEIRPESNVLDQEDVSNTHSDHQHADRATDEHDGSLSPHEAEDSAVAIEAEEEDDDHNQDLDGQANDAEEYTATGEDTSIHDRMDYEDELLANAHSPDSDDAPSNDETEIPAVTVSYKGVEYPFFYNSPDSEGKECFFDDLSLLHCKMEGVLAGFRRELANELGPFDELVFQIDELGLEFAESTQPDLISDITLGQVISVFDSLVKNQDADASKPLYALLVTRPNCKKRWLSLVDDAYNGKGLDEVSYYFASQAHSEMAEPEILDDEPGMVGEDDNADATAWPDSPAESKHDDQEDAQAQDLGEYVPSTLEDAVNQDDDVGTGVAEEDDDATKVDDAIDESAFDAELTAVVEDPDGEATMVDTDINLLNESTVVADADVVESNAMTDVTEDHELQTSGENGNPGSSLSDPCFYPKFCLCVECASTYTTHDMADNDYAYASLVRNTRQTAQSHQSTQFHIPSLEVPTEGSPRSQIRHFHSRSDVSMAFSSATNADDSFQVPEIDDSNPLVNPDAEDEVDLLNAIENDQQWPNDEDSAALVDQIIEATDENATNKVTPNTSATSTLNGDEATYENNELDMNADVGENDGADIDGQDDELEEIDWREFPGQGDDELLESPAVVGKRPRSDVDDLLDDEAEKDVKRRRS
ncbi:conserved glutamic acid-rich protein [Colletotrichum kahawae]|uniref:Conserved glutamic acid-rich protein n=1 Tax=Colletotrichum kahawae TaxID=34407 RepID=A0AAD9XXT5_COLKA|nr:conserved glutamic acid-rich protein [Colletotrichum kahawae]